MLTKHDFTAQLHSKFRIVSQDRPALEIELDQVEDTGSTASEERFSLMFYGPETINLGQGTFELEHEILGQMAMFLVPIGNDRRGFRYEAVFNRSLKSLPTA